MQTWIHSKNTQSKANLKHSTGSSRVPQLDPREPRKRFSTGSRGFLQDCGLRLHDGLSAGVPVRLRHDLRTASEGEGRV